MPGPIKASEVYGELVRVHYNLHRCPRGKDPKPGEACWVVNTKQGGKWKVLGYVPSILLKDVELKVSKAGVDRVRRLGKRKVIAWFEGVAVNPETKTSRRAIARDDWEGIGFNPFEGYSFYLYDTDEEVDYAPLTYVSGRKAIALFDMPNASGHVAEHGEGELEALIEALGGEVDF